MITIISLFFQTAPGRATTRKEVATDIEAASVIKKWLARHNLAGHDLEKLGENVVSQLKVEGVSKVAAAQIDWIELCAACRFSVRACEEGQTNCATENAKVLRQVEVVTPAGAWEPLIEKFRTLPLMITDFMFMGMDPATSTVHLYKNVMNRQYLRIDAKGQCYGMTGFDKGYIYEPISEDVALNPFGVFPSIDPYQPHPFIRLEETAACAVCSHTQGYGLHSMAYAVESRTVNPLAFLERVETRMRFYAGARNFTAMSDAFEIIETARKNVRRATCPHTSTSTSTHRGHGLSLVCDDCGEVLPAPIRTLHCCCCGESFLGRQFHNQDTGYGLGDCCVDYVTAKSDMDIARTYGIAMFHFRVSQPAKYVFDNISVTLTARSAQDAYNTLCAGISAISPNCQFVTDTYSGPGVKDEDTSELWQDADESPSATAAGAVAGCGRVTSTTAAQPTRNALGIEGLTCGTPEQFLDAAQKAQSAYWDALSELESALGVTIENSEDLSSCDVASLKEEFGDNNEDENEGAECNGEGCEVIVAESDPYFATPCGTFCSECMEKCDGHAKGCGICANEFDLDDDNNPNHEGRS